MGGCIDNFSHFFYWDGPNRHDLWRDGKEVWHEGEFFGDLMVNECGRFIEANKDRPFFLYWAINLPHYPLQGSAKWREQYGISPKPRAQYAAALSTADEMIGQVLSKLDALSLRKDTIVVLMSDHGHSTEDRTFGGGGSAGPYRGAKFSLFEGGIRVPAIISRPGTLPEGQVRGQFAVGCDWLPTLVELAGIDLTALAPTKFDGRSLAAVVRSADAPSPHEAFHWATGKDQWAVRQGDWKLIGNPVDSGTKKPMAEEDQLILVDLKNDVGEKTNLARAQPERVRRLRQLHEVWARDVAK
jgi:arylsulfatase A-like enzyme